EVAHRAGVGSVKLDRIAPRSLMPTGEKLRRIKGKEIPLRTEVAVNDVKQHRHAAVMRRFDKSLEVLRSSIACVRGIGKGSVVTPVPAALEVADRHDLNGGHPEAREVVQLKTCFRKRALRRESADMEFVEDDFVPSATLPGFLPAVSVGVY